MKLNNNAIFRVKQCVKCVYNSAPVICKKIRIIAELNKWTAEERKIGWKLMSSYSPLIVRLMLLWENWEEKNATNLQFIFKSHSDQKHIWIQIAMQFLPHPHIHSKRLKLLLAIHMHKQTSYFTIKTCCFIRSRACSEHIHHTVCVPVRRENLLSKCHYYISCVWLLPLLFVPVFGAAVPASTY